MDGMTVWIPACYEEGAKKAELAAHEWGFGSNLDYDDTPGIKEFRLELYASPDQLLGNKILSGTYANFVDTLAPLYNIEGFALTIYTDGGIWLRIAKAVFEPEYQPEYITTY